MTWQDALQQCSTDPYELAAAYGVDPAPLALIAERYPLRITPDYRALIQAPGDPIWRQCVPDLSELHGGGVADPLDEERLSPVPGLVHRYPDRALWLVGGDCALYCRFCTRKRRIGTPSAPPDIDGVIAYLEKTPQIREVILSGGDPLLLSDEILDAILVRLRRIQHVAVLRLHTRVPAVLPQRIDDRLCAVLRRSQPLYLMTHFNHPRELTAAARAACALLADSGIPLGNQAVLLRGVNDDAAVLGELFWGLLQMRVRPYYLHQLDQSAGTRHFAVDLDAGCRLLASLRGTLSGYALPHYVVDLPGGRGKVPVGADYRLGAGRPTIVRTLDGTAVCLEPPAAVEG